ncbi:MAG TPA: YaiI/YqxD family protein, partial [Hyphomicrobiaceae bacterium]|nr:YaiI/YqxD family protein [Hyphomicrobiaceae bacterium]
MPSLTTACDTSTATAAPQIYVDADACPVKDEIVRVAERHGLAAVFVSNAWMRLPDS